MVDAITLHSSQSSDLIKKAAMAAEESEIVVVNTTDHAMNFTPELLHVLRRTIEKFHEIDPFVKHRREHLSKAFITWSRCAPLIQICGELKRQLQERSSVFELLRESYLRDVVSVKHHLDKIAPLGKQFSKI